MPLFRKQPVAALGAAGERVANDLRRIRELEQALRDARGVLERYAAPYNAANDAIERIEVVLRNWPPAKQPTEKE